MLSAFLSGAQATEPGAKQADDVFEEVEDGGGDGTHLNDGGVGRDCLVVDRVAQQVFDDRQVPGR